MRVWDLPPDVLCRQHLLGEHREIHALHTILTEGREGYRNHPETKRWEGKLSPLVMRHNVVASEMLNRGYNHNSPLDFPVERDGPLQDELLLSRAEQRERLRNKDCPCPRNGGDDG